MKNFFFYSLFFVFVSLPQAHERDPFLNELQYRSFLYFWEQTNPENGLTPDRFPTPSFSSIAAVGFALAAYGVGVERGWIEREKAIDRVLTTLKFFWEAPQGDSAQGVTGYKGFFYHFLDQKTGLRYPGVELSSIDTALLLAGILFCGAYFDGDHPKESQIRSYAEKIYGRVDWRWMQKRASLLCMGWHPETGFIPSDWQGYNEAMILYFLALGSPTYPISSEAWAAWTKTYRWGKFYGEEYLQFSPLFGHQYSHIFVDFKGVQDAYMKAKGIDYFENSRRATYANRQYCIENPQGYKGYGEDIWGLTACDGPADTTRLWQGQKREFHSYWARGASLIEIQDDGTIAPTAVAGSLPFAPEIGIPALKKMRSLYPELWGQYGFRDAFNPSYETPDSKVCWIDQDWLGIDNGPIVLMIENYHSPWFWNVMKRCPFLRRGMLQAGFQGGWLSEK